jgi:hypothetical protein
MGNSKKTIGLELNDSSYSINERSGLLVDVQTPKESPIAIDFLFS